MNATLSADLCQQTALAIANRLAYYALCDDPVMFSVRVLNVDNRLAPRHLPGLVRKQHSAAHDAYSETNY
jgi:hypothetical protein